MPIFIFNGGFEISRANNRKRPELICHFYIKVNRDSAFYGRIDMVNSTKLRSDNSRHIELICSDAPDLFNMSDVKFVQIQSINDICPTKIIIVGIN